MNKIEVSIITPCFNASNTIYQTLLSIKNQTFNQYEVLIIDDFSNDKSVFLIKKFIKNDNRFKLFARKKNHGVVSSRNYALSKAKGRYIAFLDSDDLWKKDFLKNSIMVHKKYNSGITHANYYRFFLKKNKCYGQKVISPLIINRKNCLNKNFIGLLTAVIDREIVGEFYFKDTRPEDYLLWYELIFQKNLYSRSIKSTEAYYRISDDQRSKNKFKSLLRIIKFYSDDLKLRPIPKLINILKWISFNLIQRMRKDKFMAKSMHEEIYK